jgi:Zn-dependent protease
MKFAPSVRHRVSKRGLVIAGAEGDAFLLEHPRATELPGLLAGAADPDELVHAWGPGTRPLVDELVDLGVLVAHRGSSAEPVRATARRVRLTRSGLEIDGLEEPARRIGRALGPLWLSWPGRIALLAVVAAGVFCLVRGRPDVPEFSAHPWVDALLGVTLTLGCACLHELAHAVALVHYGRRPRRAGCGFYWGGLSFFVDSTEAVTLPRRARVVQALVGLAVDTVTLSLLAVVAQVSTSPLIAGVAWRVAVLSLLSLVLNLLPVLSLDGHWALADHLDEPELAGRARAALGSALRAGRVTTERWLVVYGAISVVGGVALLVAAGFVWWAAAGDLLAALLTGDLPDVVVGLVLVGPFAAGLLFSTLGLVLEVTAQPDVTPAPGIPAPEG